MVKKDFECQVHTWIMKKGKKAIVYKAKKKRRRGTEKERNQISRACPKRLIVKLYAHVFNFFTLKSNISAQDSD